MGLTLHRKRRRMFDSLMFSQGLLDFSFPLFFDTVTVLESIGPDTVTVEGDFRYTAFRSNEYMILSDQNGNAETVLLGEVRAYEIDLASAPTRVWSAGTRMHPAVRGRIEADVGYAQLSDSAVEATLSVQQIGNAEWTFSSIGWGDLWGDLWGGYGLTGNPLITLYRDFPMFDTPPNYRDSGAYGYRRLAVETDNGVGIPSRLQVGSSGFPSQQYRTMLVGRKAQSDFRAFLYALKGRVTPVWLPTFFEDFEVVEDVTAGGNTLVVERSMFTAVGGPVIGRQDIQLKTYAGVKITRRIVSSSYLDGTREQLTLDAVFENNIAVGEIKTVSFVALCRLDQDAVDFAHRTDTAGVAEVTMVFRAVPDLRQVVT